MSTAGESDICLFSLFSFSFDELCQDVHPQYARNAISLVASVPFDIRLSSFADIERIFPGFLSFSGFVSISLYHYLFLFFSFLYNKGIDASLPVVVRLYKVKYELCKQILNLPCGRAAIGRISLEYPSVDEARASKNMFHGKVLLCVLLLR